MVDPQLPPFEEWPNQYCECGNPVRKPSFKKGSKNQWRFHKQCSPCEHLRYRYGFNTPDHAVQVLGTPKCALCDCTDINKLIIDHDHSTLRVRSWLCSQCNTAIGLLGENPLTIRNALNYCTRHNASSLMFSLCQELNLPTDDHLIPPNSDIQGKKKSRISSERADQNSRRFSED